MKKLKSVMFIILGFVSLALGAIGVVLPILPTAPFLLLTSFCFASGSQRFNNWFINTKLYKNHLEGFVKSKVMTIRGQVLLLSAVSLMLFASMWFVNKLVVSIILTALILVKYLYFVLCVKTVSKAEYQKIKSQLRGVANA